MTVLLVSHLFWVIFSITLHELGHGWAAIWQGDDTPRRLGHMNMNPLVHMGPMSLIALALIGIAWGAMPVDPSRFRWKRKGNALVSAAGPAVNLLLAIVCIILLAVWIKVGPVGQPVYDHLNTFFFIGAELNIVLMIFNLLPVPPLDGSAILSGLSFRWYRMLNQTNAPMIGMFIVLVLMMSGTFGFLRDAGRSAAAAGTDLLGSFMGNPALRDVLPFR